MDVRLEHFRQNIDIYVEIDDLHVLKCKLKCHNFELAFRDVFNVHSDANLLLFGEFRRFSCH